MKIYMTGIFFSLFIMTSLSFAQPPFHPDCEEEDCIEMQADFPSGPPDPDDPGFMGRKPPKLTEERIQKIMQNLETAHPEFFKKISALKKDHPKVFERTIHKLRRFMRNEKKDPEERKKLITIFTEQIEFDLILERYHAEKDPGKKEKIKAEMLKQMTATFDKKEEMKLEILKNIEKNLEAKKKIHEKRMADKDKIIKEDLEKIIKFHEKMEEKNK